MKNLFAVIALLLMLGACSTVNEETAVAPTTMQTASATETAKTPPIASALSTEPPTSLSQPISTPLIDVLMEPTATPSPTHSPTLPPVPTSAVVEGWLLYQNEFYEYQFSYPPEANIGTSGITGFDPAEKPAGLTGDQYRAQLRRKYPDDICVGVNFENGFVFISPPEDKGGKYSKPCPGLGIGDYDVFSLTETVVVNGRTYTAEGWEVRDRDEAGSWRNEFFILHLEDGTTITFGGGNNYESGEAAYETFMATKESLLQIVTSYMPIQ